MGNKKEEAEEANSPKKRADEVNTRITRESHST